MFPRLYPILDTALLAQRGLGVHQAAAAILDGGARILQLRHKGHWARAMFNDAEEIARMCRESGALFIINDRADMAMLLGAGLHVGQDDMEPADARKLLGSNAVLGLSTHNDVQFSAAVRQPVDYVAFGPIFATSSKWNPDPVVGVEALQQVRASTALPLVAIGGITRENAPYVMRAGADSIAVIGDLYPQKLNPNLLRQRVEVWNSVLQDS